VVEVKAHTKHSRVVINVDGIMRQGSVQRLEKNVPNVEVKDILQWFVKHHKYQGKGLMEGVPNLTTRKFMQLNKIRMSMKSFLWIQF